MNATTLCNLIAQRIDPTYFQLWGLEVHWMSPDYDTPENRAIVADVIANYDKLAVEYEAEQEKIAWNNAIYAKLAEIDAKTIRSLREGDMIWVAKHEAAAKEERAKLK